ncbi:hypothetical protein ACGFX4_10475 [Kitasatospora sp. NPDC048365]|uniref:hypothetical protein n=1 Tax=Kitasatospora sp. NPDC048365 TaxID=3364050 RepID=UPI003716AEF6
MLVSLTRVGPARQSLTKGVAVTGVDTGALLRSATLPGPPPSVPAAELRADGRAEGLLSVALPGAWLGTPAAREAAFGYLGAVLAALAGSARALGGALHAPGVRLAPTGPLPPLGGDLHGLATVDDAEQEVLGNLLRRHSPTLIALTGRVRVGGPADRVGSRRLADSREHLAARYLASTDPRHLHHVRAELRRRHGIADLLRMDVAPVPAGPGTPAETLVRCVDAQVSLADLRAQALLLGALALKARRTVRAGERERNVPQSVIEANRARAVVHGLRARFVPETTGGGSTGGRSTGGPSADPGRAQRTRPAREAARRLLTDLVPELRLLDATAEELLPLLAPVELPSFGLPGLRTQDLLLRTARQNSSSAALAQQAEYLLHDPRPGGELPAVLAQDSPGVLELLLSDWRRTLAEGVAPAAGAEPSARSDRPGSGRQGNRGNGNPRRQGRRPGHQEPGRGRTTGLPQDRRPDRPQRKDGA